MLLGNWWWEMIILNAFSFWWAIHCIILFLLYYLSAVSSAILQVVQHTLFHIWIVIYLLWLLNVIININWNLCNRSNDIGFFEMNTFGNYMIGFIWIFWFLELHWLMTRLIWTVTLLTSRIVYSHENAILLGHKCIGDSTKSIVIQTISPNLSFILLISPSFIFKGSDQLAWKSHYLIV